MAKATFAAGCFWGVEDVYRQVPGVTDVTSGYTGGHADDPTYDQVCTDGTGHAEAVTVGFDPERVSYDDLLEIFFEIHDPTTLDRQGPDVGSQYRSAIYFHDGEQEIAARRALARAQARHARPIVTEVARATAFYSAEEYHQRYYSKRGMAGCHVLPERFRRRA